ncbi:hypothetical protein [Spirulina sp. 06S082]|nr:hypothetical protein [Spirulina sp. 06S082]MEA5468332.1 hypothetical protein [Spirulina sp. 06S082]
MTSIIYGHYRVKHGNGRDFLSNAREIIAIANQKAAIASKN